MKPEQAETPEIFLSLVPNRVKRLLDNIELKVPSEWDSPERDRSLNLCPRLDTGLLSTSPFVPKNFQLTSWKLAPPTPGEENKCDDSFLYIIGARTVEIVALEDQIRGAVPSDLDSVGGELNVDLMIDADVESIESSNAAKKETELSDLVRQSLAELCTLKQQFYDSLNHLYTSLDSLTNELGPELSYFITNAVCSDLDDNKKECDPNKIHKYKVKIHMADFLRVQFLGYLEFTPGQEPWPSLVHFRLLAVNQLKKEIMSYYPEQLSLYREFRSIMNIKNPWCKL